MKALNSWSHALSIGAAVVILAACGGNQSAAPQLPAMQVQPQSRNAERTQVRVTHNRVRYVLEDVGTFGGPHSGIVESSQWLLPDGILTGFADTPKPDPYAPNCFGMACYIQHAFLWKGHILHDLGRCRMGRAAGRTGSTHAEIWQCTSQNGVLDPILGQQNRAVLWRHGGTISERSAAPSVERAASTTLSS
ncbi:MAG TPA: hypothetical protein VIW73_13255 [Candidatus Cybelea sp.]